eukprot:gene31886-6189_t
MSNNAFQQRKASVLAGLQDKCGDKSRKGSVDERCLALVNVINDQPNVYTTSSCSGRIMPAGAAAAAGLLPVGRKGHKETRAAGKKGGAWVFASHDPVSDPQEVLRRVKEGYASCGRLVMRFEPFILHAECDSVTTAAQLLHAAKLAGFRESGLSLGAAGQRAMVGVRCSLRLEAPVADNGQMLVPDDHILYLVKLCNEKFDENTQRIAKLVEQLRILYSPSPLLAPAASTKRGKGKHQAQPHAAVFTSPPTLAPHPPPQGCGGAWELGGAVARKAKRGPGDAFSALQQLKQRQEDALSKLTALEKRAACVVGQHPSTLAVKPSRAGKAPAMSKATVVVKLAPAQPLSWHPLISSPSPAPSDLLGAAPSADLSPESMLRWGHATVTHKHCVIVIGGYGGEGSHTRRADVLVYDGSAGTWTLAQETAATKGLAPEPQIGHAAKRLAPEPRMGHVAAMMGEDHAVLIGGRTSPAKALNDVIPSTANGHKPATNDALKGSNPSPSASAPVIPSTANGHKPATSGALKGSNPSPNASAPVIPSTANGYKPATSATSSALNGSNPSSNASAPVWPGRFRHAAVSAPLSGGASAKPGGASPAGHCVLVFGGRDDRQIFSDLWVLKAEVGETGAKPTALPPSVGETGATPTGPPPDAGETGATPTAPPPDVESLVWTWVQVPGGSAQDVLGDAITPTELAGSQAVPEEGLPLQTSCAESAPWPCPRNSHAMAIAGDQVYLHGGMSGYGRHYNCMYCLSLTEALKEVADVQAGSKLGYVASPVGKPPATLWKHLMPKQTTPPACFSHSLTAWHEPSLAGPVLLLAGGYPTAHHDSLFVFDTTKEEWNRVKISIPPPEAHGNFVPVRHSAGFLPPSSSSSDIGSLVLVGGGAFCFSFGSIFSQAWALDLLPVLQALQSPVVLRPEAGSPLSSHKAIQSLAVPRPEAGSPLSSHKAIQSLAVPRPEAGSPQSSHKAVSRPKAVPSPMSQATSVAKKAAAAVGGQGKLWGKVAGSKVRAAAPAVVSVPEEGGSPVLEVAALDAKPVKDALKVLGWLDKEQKAGKLSVSQPTSSPAMGGNQASAESNTIAASSTTSASSTVVLLPLTPAGVQGIQAVSAGARLSYRNLSLNAKHVVTPAQAMRIAVLELIQPPTSSTAPTNSLDPEPLTPTSTTAATNSLAPGLLTPETVQILLADLPLKWERLGDLALIPAGSISNPLWKQGTRDSRAELLLGDDGWVSHKEGGVTFQLDVTKCMFSSGNVTERTRMGKLICKGETLVDLFTGIGYFTVPLLTLSGVCKSYACEWNPNAIEALRRNLAVNGVDHKCEVLPGDSNLNAPKSVADRVLLGLLPSSEGGWAAAVAALKPTGGWLHVHENAVDKEEESWERVKWYAPHIRHLVLDLQVLPEGAANALASATRALEALKGPLKKGVDNESLAAQNQKADNSPKMYQKASVPCIDHGSLAAQNQKADNSPKMCRSTGKHLLPDPCVDYGGDAAQNQKSVDSPRTVPVWCSHTAPKPSPSSEAPWFTRPWSELQPVARLAAANVDHFESVISPARQPVIFEGLDVGPATTKWTPEYLMTLPKSSKTKNFKFKLMTLSELVNSIQSSAVSGTEGGSKERFYLRSIGENPRKDPANLATSFPDLAPDLKLPSLVPTRTPSDQLDPAILAASFPDLAPDLKLPSLDPANLATSFLDLALDIKLPSLVPTRTPSDQPLHSPRRDPANLATSFLTWHPTSSYPPWFPPAHLLTSFYTLSQDPANLATSFPDLAPDLKLPSLDPANLATSFPDLAPNLKLPSLVPTRTPSDQLLHSLAGSCQPGDLFPDLAPDLKLPSLDPANLATSFPDLALDIKLPSLDPANLATSFPDLAPDLKLPSLDPANLATSFPDLAPDLKLPSLDPANLATSFPDLAPDLKLPSLDPANLATSFPDLAPDLKLPSLDPANLATSFPDLALDIKLPSLDPANLATSFPDLAPDIKVPSLVPKDAIFSTVIRMGSAGLRLDGQCFDSDSGLQDSADVASMFREAVPIVCILHPGDVLFIPSLWFHNVVSEECAAEGGSSVRDGEPSISVNVFWRHLHDSQYERKDLYGNRDLVQANAADRATEEAVQQLGKLEEHYKQFYGRRVVSTISKELGLM